MHPTNTVAHNQPRGRPWAMDIQKWTAIILFLIVFSALAFIVLAVTLMFVAGGDCRSQDFAVDINR